MSRLAPFRHQIRDIAEECGIPCALGGPVPPGRRFDVTIHDGLVVGDGETSARWRGHILLRQEPAPLHPHEATRLHAAAVSLSASLEVGLCRCEFIGSDPPVLLGVEFPQSTPERMAAVMFTAYVTAGEPAARPGTGLVSGLLTALELPEQAHSEYQAGQAVTLPTGTVVVTVRAGGSDERSARTAIASALYRVRIDGLATNLQLLQQAADSDVLAAGLSSSRQLDALPYAPLAIEVQQPGMQTSVQDWPGRYGFWKVGVPPSGAMDDLALRLANHLVGNLPSAAAIEVTMSGPVLKFHSASIACLVGAPFHASLDGRPFPMWRAQFIRAGAVLTIGTPVKHGLRAILAIRHGINVPAYLGSRSTFDLGGFGGFQGRTLRAGDWLPLTRPSLPGELVSCPPPVPPLSRPGYVGAWTIGVLEGPHAAPDFFTAADMEMIYATSWEVHHNSNRTGIRLVGPKPAWARRDGGEAGLHPSNIHDNAYAVGAIDFTGDMPILLGPDGPSLGGFVCPAVVIAAERWKLGQLRPGDTVRFSRKTAAEAKAQLASQVLQLAAEAPLRMLPPAVQEVVTPALAIIYQDPSRAVGICIRRSGDRYLLIEYGLATLDLALRLRVHQLMQAIELTRPEGILDLTPGIRSLQIHHEPTVLTQERLVQLVLELDRALEPIDRVRIAARTLHLPLSWDDPATQLATERYMRTVRADAPWCPSNLEFIRRINGLETIQQVYDIVFAAEYLVLGLGDVYLGAPVATPLDPRHRLVTTKYNPARTWTPQNAVGIGGAYLCIYGMEGPGGYQFVGRTVPVWKSYGPWLHESRLAPAGGAQPWLLRFFDRIRFYPVSAERLLRLRAGDDEPGYGIRSEASVFDWSAYQAFLGTHAASIGAFRERQRSAFDAERGRWEEQGRVATTGGTLTQR